ncbi:uncharacterized protein LOC116347479 [Contarinia nasturtii]|uniref:uncharacterized protein LOC116347479 n=1 Tax=Contarinia nasturtii TaxID=265458 RepID=UPI0012D498E4|nr:uncharacterized protein LOC116347479 [Contarinia nasturtii]
MSQEQNSVQSGPSAKKMKSNDEENNPAERAVVINVVQQLADIFKLNIDCFEEVFDYLSLKDLAAIGQTCKRMQQIAGHCFQLNYGAIQARFYECGFDCKDVKIDCFSNLIQSVYLRYKINYNIDERDERTDTGVKNAINNQTKNFLTPFKHFTPIKEITIGEVHLTMAWINEMEAILCKVESVTLESVIIGGENELDAFIAACSHIKYLCLCVETNGHQWMHRTYPTLEHIELDFFDWEEIPTLITFLELNTTIKEFSFDPEHFWSNRELLKKSNIKLDTLVIHLDEHEVEFDLFCCLLNELFESGFYKKLHMFFYRGFWMDQECVNELALVKGIVKFYAGTNSYGYNIGALRNLEELRIFDCDIITDLKTLPQIFLKLKRIDLRHTSSDDILTFICHSKSLNKIKVRNYDEHGKILDLFALNKERAKLVGAHKITIYVEEDVYLATKWAMKQTDFSLIEMKRSTSYDWGF